MKILKQENGSITLFVLISMIFFVMYLIGMYILMSNSESSGVAESARIKEIYEEGVNNIDDVYATRLSLEKVDPTGEISSFTSVPFGIKATIESSDTDSGVDYEKCKYVLTTNNEEIGTDETLYTDGAITQNNQTIEKAKGAGTYYLHALIVDKTGNKKEVISSNSVEIADKVDFDYTGGEEEIELLPGTYKMECWGAQGGTINSYIGGKGAYTSGTIDLNNKLNLFIYVGNQPEANDNGGYVGGGSLSSGQHGYGCPGGGATDIRLNNIEVLNFDSLKSRIMVAAGRWRSK